MVDDLRSNPRRGFEYCQGIAPIVNGAKPTAEDFFQVHCRDISPGGISFYLKDSPDFEDLVVALGKPPELMHVAARVAHVGQVERDGPKEYLVGCQFTEKISC